MNGLLVSGASGPLGREFVRLAGGSGLELRLVDSGPDDSADPAPEGQWVLVHIAAEPHPRSPARELYRNNAFAIAHQLERLKGRLSRVHLSCWDGLGGIEKASVVAGEEYVLLFQRLEGVPCSVLRLPGGLPAAAAAQALWRAVEAGAPG